MKMFEWAAELPVSITVCDKEGIITYMNNKSRKTFSSDTDDKLIGKNLKDCHSQESIAKIFHLLDTKKSNIYTIEKNTKKKMINQVPWYEENEVGGLVELSVELPDDIPHFVRD
jgi:transcriptional regulator with PAS, ATPase and Fis domain